jgi:hypothetical protein
MARIIRPTIAGMAAEGCSFKGVLFAGLMLTATGPQLIEYNVRFGDPECQVLMARLKSDLLPALIACRDGVLGQVDLRWRDETALCVVMAARGYPGEPLKGTEIRGLDAAGNAKDVTIFHAGTRADAGRILADGGRVLGVTALGRDVAVGAAPRLRCRRHHHLARGVLPPRHRLAGDISFVGAGLVPARGPAQGRNIHANGLRPRRKRLERGPTSPPARPRSASAAAGTRASG